MRSTRAHYVGHRTSSMTIPPRHLAAHVSRTRALLAARSTRSLVSTHSVHCIAQLRIVAHRHRPRQLPHVAAGQSMISHPIGQSDLQRLLDNRAPLACRQRNGRWARHHIRVDQTTPVRQRLIATCLVHRTLRLPPARRSILPAMGYPLIACPPHRHLRECHGQDNSLLHAPAARTVQLNRFPNLGSTISALKQPTTTCSLPIPPAQMSSARPPLFLKWRVVQWSVKAQESRLPVRAQCSAGAAAWRRGPRGPDRAARAVAA
mmetsp:Transcript_1609/g.4535  ORF Transcript_1609/g.4535 Transcript_1609/m.4535 type:complete len:262 (+) Transcript_1609:1959-2744(+)